MRDRLIELIRKIVHPYFAKEIADAILADGWIIPPCQVGDVVWLIKSLNWQQTEWGIKKVKFRCSNKRQINLGNFESQTTIRCKIIQLIVSAKQYS